MASERDRSGYAFRSNAIVRIGALALFVVMLQVSAARAEAVFDKLNETLPDKVRSALAQINGEGRQLLAMRSYLRRTRSLEARWSWTDDEIDEYTGSEEHKHATAAVNAVIETFEEQNPGYSLYVNTHVRSLDEQIGKWNRNATVEAGAEEIEADFADWRDGHTDASADEARSFLTAWKPETTVSLAAPGLSQHGRGHAFDFQIMQNGAIIVGANTRIIDTAWEEGGWTGKLKLAVLASDARFTGPLTKPDEPWHYAYEPEED
jgi:hypothetical protein